jgi:ABC-type bacteriocin/lantibiotic exporter with double-glycine peptidase domain
MIISFIELGYSAIPAFILIIVFIPLQIYLGCFKSKLDNKNRVITHKRFHLMSEILAAIKLIKFHACEATFYEKISETRKKEMLLLKRSLIANAFNYMLVFTVPILATLFSLLTYWFSGHVVDPVVGFTFSSLLNTLRYPLFMTPLAINSTTGK